MTKASLEAGAEVGNYELLPYIATISAIKNAHGWWNGHQPLNDAAFNVALESAAKGTMAIAGGFAGKGLGMLIFGPAGAYVFGGILAVAATTESHWITNQVDEFIDPDRNSELIDAAITLLKNCIGHLEAKILGCKSKVESLPDGEIADAMRNRWEWEIAFSKSKINEAHIIQEKKKLSGEKRAITALEFASQSGIHPIWLQEDYKGLFTILQQPKDRWKKSKSWATNLFSGPKKET